MIIGSPMKLKTHSNCIVTQNWLIPLKNFIVKLLVKLVAMYQNQIHIKLFKCRLYCPLFMGLNEYHLILFLNVNSPFILVVCIYIIYTLYSTLVRFQSNLAQFIFNPRRGVMVENLNLTGCLWKNGFFKPYRVSCCKSDAKWKGVSSESVSLNQGWAIKEFI